MKNYLDLLQRTLNEGSPSKDRTGVGTRHLFGAQMRFDLERGFPLLTTKKVHFKSIAYELLWFLKGSTNIRDLQENGVRIWNEWADERGELGPIYGKQWRRWSGKDGREIDQIGQLIQNLRKNPESRRHLVSAWNVAEIPEMALPPCHAFFQFQVSNGDELRCQLYQRSADLFLGVPFNIASYSLLTHLIARVCGLRAKEFIHTLGDYHIYENHISQVKLQLQRQPRTLPRLEISDRGQSIDDFRYEDFSLLDYDPHPPIRGEVAI